MSKKINRNAPALKVPKEIRELAQEFRQQRVEKERTEKLEKQKRETEQKRVRAARLKAGLKYATKVFLWAKALRESDLGEELMKKSHPPTVYSSIIFFDAHFIPKEVPWVGLGISPNGLFLTSGGRFYSQKQVSSPKELAESVDTIILKSASVWIDDGRVWECIKRRFL